MTQWLLLFLIVCCVFMAAMMALAPRRVLRYVKSSRRWMWYLAGVFNVTQDSMSGIAAMRWVRIQGIVGLAAALVALYAWMCGT